MALAAASYQPSMGIFQATYRPGGAGAVTIVVAQEKADDPTAKIIIYVGLGYTTTLGQAPGTTIGSVVAHVEPLDLTTNSVPLTGPLKTDNPASYVSNLCAPGLHEAVWVLNAALPGQPANPIPVYVDHTAGAEAALGSAKLQICFAPPDVPMGTPGRAPKGAKFLDAAFTISGVFKNRATAGEELWRSLFTPFTPKTGAPDAAATTEAQGIVPMPYSISARRRPARSGFFRLAGKLNLAGAAPGGISLTLYAGVKKKSGLAFSPVSVTNTRRHGLYAFTRRLPAKTTYFFVERGPTSRACATPTIVASCTTAITSNAISAVIKIAPAKRRHR
ncbi:MAG TPA: hypothetical protein VF002_06330 [Gaiellaceae bacterium]